MAEKGAHLTTTQQIRPSIFEVVAADSLDSTFYPAIKRICNVGHTLVLLQKHLINKYPKLAASIDKCR